MEIGVQILFSGAKHYVRFLIAYSQLYKVHFKVELKPNLFRVIGQNGVC